MKTKNENIIPYILVIGLVFAGLVLSGCGLATKDDPPITECTSLGGTESYVYDCEGFVFHVPKPKDGSDGSDGEKGTPGIPGATGPGGESPILGIFDPCGAHAGPDEVLLITLDGILAWYAGLGFYVLEPGVLYVTTDAQECKFKFDENYNYSDSSGLELNLLEHFL